MKKIFALVLVSGLGLSVQAQVTNLMNQHMDFRLQYNATAIGSNRLDVILGYDAGQRATNTQVYIVGNTNAKGRTQRLAFLVPAGFRKRDIVDAVKIFPFNRPVVMLIWRWVLIDEILSPEPKPITFQPLLST